MTRNWRAEDIIDIGEEEDVGLDPDVEGGVKQPQTVRILVETSDQPGVLAQVANAIADCQVNISECTVKTTEDRRAHITFALEIAEGQQLGQATSEIEKLDSVVKVRQIVTGHRRVAIVAKTGIDEEGRRWAELRSGEIVLADSTPYRNLTIEAETVAKQE